MHTQFQSPFPPIWWTRPAAILALVFGVMTLFSGGSVLFGPAQAQEWAGDYIGFVVWFNFLAGGVYVLAAIGLWMRRTWALQLATFIAVATAVVALGFAFLVLRGAAFEMRTIGALAFRFAFWAAIAMLGFAATRRA